MIATLPTAQLRAQFVLDRLFEPGALRLYATDLDRLVVGGVIPREDVHLPALPEFGTGSFCERREVGVLNIGGPGAIRVDEAEFRMEPLDCLYIGAGARDVVFRSNGGAEVARSAAFYLLSCPAHRPLPVRRACRSDALVAEIGDPENCAHRRLHRYICPGGIPSCQLMMGFTEMLPGSVWNTMPPHTHDRRSEVYLYFDLDDGFIMHLVGEARQSRHVIVRNRQAVLSPPWSLHCGVGSRGYRFAWGMAGENQDFDDMDWVDAGELL